MSLGEGECVFGKGVRLREVVQEKSLEEVRRCEREGSVEQRVSMGSVCGRDSGRM